jgi:hypothetical protein
VVLRHNVIVDIFKSLKWSATKFLTSGFFIETPKPLSILLGPFRIFSKICEIFAAQGAQVANGKNLQSEKFLNIGHAPLDSKVDKYISFFS